MPSPKTAQEAETPPMLFNSLQFSAFFPVAAGLYFLLPRAWRWGWLLAASYLFYAAWVPAYVALLWVNTIILYGSGRGMAAASRPGARRCWLFAGISMQLGLLFAFKYYNFFLDAMQPLLRLAGAEAWLPYSRIVLPLGISFYTLQAMSYCMEVYWKRQSAERRLGRLALYVAFFPQVLSGPIGHPQAMLPQYAALEGFRYASVTLGLKRMAWGLFLKSVVADRLAPLVDAVYAAPGDFAGPALALGTVFFAVQIYCDFAGYTHMAVGAAQVFGVRVPENFRQPYLARNTVEFWRRWHMSLSTWFRDYCYIPLGGNRVLPGRWVANIFGVFLLSGLWHGAAWTFVVWGMIHAGYLIAGRFTAGVRGKAAARCGLDHWPRLHHMLRISVTFLLVCLAWVFFRAPDLTAAVTLLRGLPFGWAAVFVGEWWRALPETLHTSALEAIFAAGLALFVIGADLFQERESFQARLARQPWWLRGLAYSALLWSIFLFGALRHSEFYYVQF